MNDCNSDGWRNKDIDEKVLFCIKNGVRRFNAILARCEAVRTTDMRTVDKSLQRLKRAEKAKFTDGEWTAVDNAFD